MCRNGKRKHYQDVQIFILQNTKKHISCVGFLSNKTQGAQMATHADPCIGTWRTALSNTIYTLILGEFLHRFH